MKTKYFLDSRFDVDANGAFTYEVIRKGKVVSEKPLSYILESHEDILSVAKSLTGDTYDEVKEIITNIYGNWGDTDYIKRVEVEMSKKDDWRNVQ